MKKILLFLIAFSLCKAQEEAKIPNVIPPSPESSLRTDFGKVPANEYRGMQNLQIPVTTIEYGNIKIPITLRYSKLGVKVNDISNDVGVSWILETGGVINRTIKDNPDEMYTRINFNSATEIDQLNQPDGSQGATLLSSYVNYGFDTENDIYNYVLPGLSGSFYIDLNNQVVFIEKNSPCKIEMLHNSTYNFVITSNDGTKYYFGGLNASEATFAVPYNGESNDSEGVSSYYLAKIEDTNGKVITYYYDAQPTVAFAQTKFFRQDVVVLEIISGCPQFPITNTISEKTLYRRILHPKTLKKISYDDIEYKFNRSTYSGGIKNAISKLNDIELYKAGDLKLQYKFSYLDAFNSVNSLQRFFLTDFKTLVYKNNGFTEKEKYSMEYEDPLDLPDRLSYEKDFLDYYNGKSQNIHLLPNTELFGNNAVLNNVSVSSTADRTPDFTFAKKGSLKSIVYPTKGKTSFEYESIMASKEKYAGGQLDKTNEQYPFPDNNPDQLLILKDSISSGAKISFNLLVMTHGTILAPIHRVALVNIYNNSNNLLVFSKSVSLAKGVASKNEQFDFTTSPGTDYRVELKIHQNSQDVTASCFFSYQNGHQLINDVGIRLKRMYDTDGNGNVNIKRFYYNKADKFNEKNIRLPFKPTFTSVRYEEKISNPQLYCGVPSSPFPNLAVIGAYTASLSSNATNTKMIFPNSDVPSFADSQKYRFVTISHGGDHFELGGEELEFSESTGISLINLNDPDYTFPDHDYLIESHLSRQFQTDDYELSDTGGQLLNRKIFDGQFKLKRTEENKFDMNVSTIGYNMKGTQIYAKAQFAPGVSPGTTTSNFYLMYYPLQVSAVLKRESVIKDFVKPVSAFETNINSDSYVSNKSNYTYNPLRYYVTEQKNIFSDGTVQESSYQYAHEKGNQYLISKNMIGIPLETTVIKKTDSTATTGKLISKSAVLFPTSQTDADQKTSGFALPYEMQSAFANAALSKEFTYDHYDDKGNIVQFTSKDGIPTTIIWGYNKTQPIAKIVGIDYDALNSSLVSGIVNASNDDAADPSTEPALITALDSFRKNSSLSGYQVTTYTYDPLIGVTSITPPSGIREIYLYDNANRLMEIRENNATGKLIKEFKYNYKQ